MIGATIELVEIAHDATRGMSDDEKIVFVVEVCHGVSNPRKGPALS